MTRVGLSIVDVIELLGQAFEIAYSITVAVVEGADEYLVAYTAVFPALPGGIRGRYPGLGDLRTRRRRRTAGRNHDQSQHQHQLRAHAKRYDLRVDIAWFGKLDTIWP